jgi:hypothetical protein
MMKFMPSKHVLLPNPYLAAYNKAVLWANKQKILYYLLHRHKDYPAEYDKNHGNRISNPTPASKNRFYLSPMSHPAVFPFFISILGT